MVNSSLKVEECSSENRMNLSSRSLLLSTNINQALFEFKKDRFPMGYSFLLMVMKRDTLSINKGDPIYFQIFKLMLLRKFPPINRDTIPF